MLVQEISGVPPWSKNRAASRAAKHTAKHHIRNTGGVVPVRVGEGVVQVRENRPALAPLFRLPPESLANSSVSPYLFVVIRGDPSCFAIHPQRHAYAALWAHRPEAEKTGGVVPVRAGEGAAQDAQNRPAPAPWLRVPPESHSLVVSEVSSRSLVYCPSAYPVELDAFTSTPCRTHGLSGSYPSLLIYFHAASVSATEYPTAT